MEKTRVVKIIDYNFQKESQLTEAYDDSNSMRKLSSDFEKFVVGRYGSDVSVHKVEDYKVILLPTKWGMDQVARYILDRLQPDTFHMHGSHGWPQYPYYAKFFRPHVKNMIFSHAATSCGTPDFLSNFDHIIVNHQLQIDRMKCHEKDKSKIIIRTRSADPDVFHASYAENSFYDFVFVSGFLLRKHIISVIDASFKSSKSLVVLGDFTRTTEGYNQTRTYINNNKMQDTIFLRDFISQQSMSGFLGGCKVFVWPNGRPDNPSTTTNRAVPEALACGMPLLLGEQAFEDTDFVIDGENGYLYSNDPEDFSSKADKILNNLTLFRRNSLQLAKERFSFQTNFVDFYNELYS